MNVEKHVASTETYNIDIYEVTLLTEEEYVENKDVIPLIYDWWWLKSYGYHDYDVPLVYLGGSRMCINVNYADGCVRPALWADLGEFERGDKFDLAGYTWTVLSDSLALCDEIVGQTAFRTDWQAVDANDYEQSDIKQYLENWRETNGIQITL